MRAGIVVSVTPQDRILLEAIVADRNTRQKHAARARVIVATAEGCGTTEIMRRSGLSKPVVWRWQERFMQEGVDGLLRDKTRKPGKPPLPAETVRRVLDLTLADPPGEATHWSVLCSLVELQAAINRYVAEHNKHPKPFTWTADPDRVLAAITRGKQVLESLH